MEYKIVKEWNQNTFETEVNYLLGLGWTLQGGVSISLNPQTNNTFFAQALVKVKE